MALIVLTGVQRVVLPTVRRLGRTLFTGRWRARPAHVAASELEQSPQQEDVRAAILEESGDVSFEVLEKDVVDFHRDNRIVAAWLKEKDRLLLEKDQQIKDLRALIEQKDRLQEEKDRQLELKDRQLVEKDSELEEKNSQIQKLTATLEQNKRKLKELALKIDRLEQERQETNDRFMQVEKRLQQLECDSKQADGETQGSDVEAGDWELLSVQPQDQLSELKSAATDDVSVFEEGEEITAVVSDEQLCRTSTTSELSATEINNQYVQPSYERLFS